MDIYLLCKKEKIPFSEALTLSYIHRKLNNNKDYFDKDTSNDISILRWLLSTNLPDSAALEVNRRLLLYSSSSFRDYMLLLYKKIEKHL